MTDTEIFLEWLDAQSRFTFQTFDDSPEKNKALAQMRHGPLAKHLDWLKRQNDAGAGVFVTVNQTDGHGRLAKNVQQVRALFVDLDGAPIEPVRTGPLAPHVVIESSSGRWHAYWKISDCPLEAFRPLQRGLIARFNADESIHDLPRVMRLPGFMHGKGEPFLTRIADFNELPPYSVSDVLAAFGWASVEDADPRKEQAQSPAPHRALEKSDADVEDDLRDALRRIDSNAYDVWIAMGNALKTLGDRGYYLWVDWSSSSAKFNEHEMRKRWDGFRADRTGYAAVFAEAKRHGWDPAQSPSNLRRRSMRRPQESKPSPVGESNGSAPPPSADSEPDHFSIDTSEEAMLRRYELVYGSRLVWDCDLSMTVPFNALVALVGKDIADKWFSHKNRRVRIPPKKEKKTKPPKDFDAATPLKVEWMLPRYALIYGEEAVFDRAKRMEVTLGALRAYCGLKAVRDWGDHPNREVVEKDDVIFDPRRSVDEPTICNIWGGWPIEPGKGNSDDEATVQRWLGVLHYVCGESDAVFNWVLKWIAYPLQKPGTKMKASIIMHGPEGSGKNTVWDAVRRIYGQYGIQITQTQLEQQWCDWLSAKLFIVGNEVLHRQEQVQQKGRLKSIVTDEEIRIERKFMAGRTEHNFANLVFLSNELRPLSIDPGDRRFLVIWTPPPHPDGMKFYLGLGEDQMSPSAISALYNYFLHIPLEDFTPHTKPPMTQAKQDLIDASMQSDQRFIRDWLADSLPVAVRPCRTQQLYHAYLYWCRVYGERFPKPENQFAARAKKDMPWGVKRYLVTTSPKQATFYLPPPSESNPRPPEIAESTWLGNQDEAFKKQLEEWRTES